MKKYDIYIILICIVTLINLVFTYVSNKSNTYIGFSDAVKSYGFTANIKEIKIITPGAPQQVVFDDEDLINVFVSTFDDLMVKQASFDSGMMSSYKVILEIEEGIAKESLNLEIIHSSLKVEKCRDYISGNASFVWQCTNVENAYNVRE